MYIVAHLYHLKVKYGGGLGRDGKGRDNDGGDGEEEKEYFGND